MIIRLLSIFLILVSVLFAGFLAYPPAAPFSPLGIPISPQSASVDAQKYIVLGFLPYWNMKKVSDTALSVVTDLAFFALRLDGQGNIVTRVTKREEEPGYTNYKRLLLNSGRSDQNRILTFAAGDQDALEMLLPSATYRQNAIRNITDKIRESGAAGVNIDFEPLGNTPPSLKNNFTVFIRDLKKNLCPDISVNCPKVSVSTYASAATKPRIWDLAALAGSADYFVIMTYDYTLPSDSKSGPNSPLRGAGTLFENDIVTNLAEITKVIPARQVLLGIPFYGYEWDTTETAKYVSGTGRGSLASLERIQKLINDKTVELLWDRNSLTPYAVRREDGKVISQIYFEDVSSIKLKLDLVKEAGLGGIAIWALGYEGENQALWSAISENLIGK